MRTALCLIALLFAGFATAEPITGTYSFSCGWDVWGHSGPFFFGTIPTGEIVEYATASESWGFGIETVTRTIPLPQYEDGTDATLDEIMFSLRGGAFTSGSASWSVQAEWSGGNDLILSFNGPYGNAFMDIEVIAFRQGSVGAAPLNFGQLKALFE